MSVVSPAKKCVVVTPSSQVRSAQSRWSGRFGGAIWSHCAARLFGRSAAMPVSLPAGSAADAGEPTGALRSLVDEMLDRHRYALLLRRQLIGNLTPEELVRTREALA